MALTMDDRLLGERVDNYCSSSEGEDEHDNNESNAYDDHCPTQTPECPNQISTLTAQPQTGPKGVLSDYKEFRRRKQIKQMHKEIELLNLSKSHALSCRTHTEDILAAEEEKKLSEALDMFEEDDEFLKQYRQKRIEEMLHFVDKLPVFGKVYDLNARNFVEAIDGVDGRVAIIIHVYETSKHSCKKVDEYFQLLCQQFVNVKFARIRACDAQLSYRFSCVGVPAILIYKKGELVGVLLQVTRDLGEEFCANDLENYLIERGFLPDRTLLTLMNTNQKATLSSA